MDFHRLARRELQTLCKKNKIPANMTNVAMVDALNALEMVEGIEEFLKPCESETAQSSIESPVRSEVTSPYVPPTGGRSTRRRSVVKEQPESVKPMTRSRRTTRKTLVKDADELQVDATETPVVVPRTSRKKALMASACRKMDSKLKECVEEDKKDAIMTPAPSGVTSRRRAVKKESEINRVYSTRRSVRLAQKNVELLKEMENETPAALKKELFTKDHEIVEMNQTETSDDLNQISGITGGDENTNVVAYFEKKDEVESVSAPKQDMSLVNEGEMVRTGEEEIGNHFEADGSKPEVNDDSDVQVQEVGFDFENEAEFNEQTCDKTDDPMDENIVMPLNVHSEVQESDGSHDVHTLDIEITDEQNEAEFDEQTCDKTDDPMDENIVMPLNVHSEVQESDGSHDVHTLDIEITVENKEELNADKDTEEYEVKAAEQKEGIEVVSAPEQDTLIISGEIVSSVEEETSNHFGADGSKPEEVRFGIEIKAAFDQQKCDRTEDPKIEDIVMPMSNEVQESNGSHDDLHTSEIEITFENEEELDTNKDADYEGKATECKQNIVLESEEASSDADVPHEIEKDTYNVNEDVTYFNVNEEVPETKEAMPNTVMLMDVALSEIAAAVSETNINPDESADFVISEAKKESTDAIHQATDDDSFTEMPSDISLTSEENEAKMKLYVTNWNAVIAELTEKHDPIGEKNEISSEKETEEPHEIGIVQLEEITKSADDVISDFKEESTDVINQNTYDSDISLVSEEDETKMKLNITNWNTVIADLCDNQDPIGERDGLNLVKYTEKTHEVGIVQHENSTKPADQAPADTSTCLQTHPVAGLDSRLISKPTSLTPIKSSASKASATKKKMTAAVSDNKENIGSGSKLVILTKERVKTAKKTAQNVENLDHLSMRKLSKMLKEKLTITTNKENKNENENEYAPARPALQALPENR